MGAEKTCWICGGYATGDYRIDDMALVADCRRCGKYEVTEQIRASSNDAESEALRPYLAAHIRQTVGGKRFVVTSDWRTIARSHANSTIHERLRHLREWVGSRTKFGVEIEEDLDVLAPLVNASGWGEVQYLLRYLEEVGQVRTRKIDVPSQKRPAGFAGERMAMELTVDGWEAISPIAGAGIAGTCFVAMSFDPTLNEAYDNGIVPAVLDDCKFRDIRLDRVQHNGWITDRIMADLRASQFVVADFTLQRQNVYFEAGFAHGLGRVVIGTCRADEFDRQHFDVRQRNHIKWRDPADLRSQLTERIRATVTLPARLS